jgi:hypothetical protein
MIRLLSSLPLCARRCLDALEVEHCRHAGRENGHLIFTYSDFARWGMSRKSVERGICWLEKTGVIRVQHGRRSYADLRTPSIYTLTHLPTFENGKWVEATNDWKTKNQRQNSTGAGVKRVLAQAKSQRQKVTDTPQKPASEEYCLLYSRGGGRGRAAEQSTPSPSPPAPSPEAEHSTLPPALSAAAPSLTLGSSSVVPFARRRVP